MENMEKGVGLLGKLLNLMKKYGFWNIIKSLAVLLILAYVIFFALNPTYLLDRVARVQEERHTEATNKRIMADKEIQLLIETARVRTEADRVWLIEFHNGDKNLASGLPFLFGSMRLEATADSIAGVEEEYMDFSLSRYPLMNTMLLEGYFYGSIDDVKQADNKLYYKLCSNGVADIAMLTIYSGDKPLGILGITWCGENRMNPRTAGLEIRRTGMQIASLLV